MVGKTFSVYIKDDDLIDWINKIVEKFRNFSHLFEVCLRHYKEETEGRRGK